MNKYMNYSYRLRQIILFIIGISLVSRYKIDGIKVIYYFLLFSLLVVNDYYRINKFYNNEKIYYISLTTSIIFGTILVYLTDGNTSAYIFMTIYEVVMFNYGLKAKILTGIQVVLIFILQLTKASYDELFSKAFWIENSIELLMSIFIIGAYILSILFMKLEIREKKKVKDLNKNLEESYKKLKEYSLEIEELTISKERNRVAGEIHDSLGHSLTALIIHLDFIEKILYSDTDKAKDLIVKTQVLARNSMNEVRKAVYALKDDLVSTNLIDSINELINNLALNDNINIKHNIVGDIEKLHSDYKNILYRTIQEGLTNSIKHGKASEIIIKLCKLENDITLNITDNGIGCNKVTEGNGIKGIKDRIETLGGQLQYFSNKNGFNINISIPYEEVEYEQNKVNAC